MKKQEWISVHDRLPEYGVPVLVIYGKTVQHITYMLDGADDVPDWFEPYHFDHDSEETFFYHMASFWMPLPESPLN